MGQESNDWEVWSRWSYALTYLIFIYLYLLERLDKWGWENINNPRQQWAKIETSKEEAINRVRLAQSRNLAKMVGFSLCLEGRVEATGVNGEELKVLNNGLGSANMQRWKSTMYLSRARSRWVSFKQRIGVEDWGPTSVQTMTFSSFWTHPDLRRGLNNYQWTNLLPKRSTLYYIMDSMTTDLPWHWPERREDSNQMSEICVIISGKTKIYTCILCGEVRGLYKKATCGDKFFYSFALIFWLYIANITASLWKLKWYLVTSICYYQASHKV